MKIPFPGYVSTMIARLRECGFSAYAVGGCIRDSLSGRSPNDWDITASSLPHETAEAFNVPGFRVHIGTGLRHGTVTVSMGNNPHAACEITTFRCDGTYSDHRRPDAVSFVSDLREDLARRDFTMNAMAAAPMEDGAVEFCDPFGGRADLDAKIIRCVGDPRRRFTEDALRILRGIRFRARFGYAFDEATAAAMHMTAPLLAHIAPERIGTELRGILSGAACAVTVDQFPDVYSLILPCAPSSCDRGDSWEIRLALLCRNAGEAALRESLMRMAFGAETVGKILRLIRFQAAPLDTHAARCAVADAFGEAGTAEYFRFRRALHPADAALAEAQDKTLALFTSGACYNTATLAIGGRDLIAAGIPAGPLIGQIVKELTCAVIAGELQNDPASLTQTAKHLAAQTKK